MERAGAAGIQIEDQVFPKKCGHFAGKAVIPLGEMVQKIKAACDARRDHDFQIIARTDAIAVEGIDAAMDRAHAFIEAGADVTFVEAPETLADVDADLPRTVGAADHELRPWRQHPELRRAEAAEAGFAAVLYANAALQAALLAVREVLADLGSTGSLHGVANRLASFETRQDAVRKDDFDALERKYA